MFRPREGQLWTFYNETLQSLLQKQGTQYVANPASGIQLTPAFVSFFNKAARFSEAVYPSGINDPGLRYSLAVAALGSDQGDERNDRRTDDQRDRFQTIRLDRIRIPERANQREALRRIGFRIPEPPRTMGVVPVLCRRRPMEPERRRICSGVDCSTGQRRPPCDGRRQGADLSLCGGYGRRRTGLPERFSHRHALRLPGRKVNAKSRIQEEFRMQDEFSSAWQLRNPVLPGYLI